MHAPLGIPLKLYGVPFGFHCEPPGSYIYNKLKLNAGSEINSLVRLFLFTNQRRHSMSKPKLSDSINIAGAVLGAVIVSAVIPSISIIVWIVFFILVVIKS